MTKSPPKTRSKLLVLIPDEDFDEVRLAKKAQSLAEYFDLDIQFIGKIDSFETEPSLHRKLVTLSGIAQTGFLTASFFSSTDHSWLKIVRGEFKSGDYILCCDEILLRGNPFSIRPLSGDLRQKYGAALLTIKGFLESADGRHPKSILMPITNWVGIFIIITVAFILEFSFGHSTFGWMRIFGEFSIVGLEILSLWFWNSLTNRG
jgi:hypothetical protein